MSRAVIGSWILRVCLALCRSQGNLLADLVASGMGTERANLVHFGRGMTGPPKANIALNWWPDSSPRAESL